MSKYDNDAKVAQLAADEARRFAAKYGTGTRRHVLLIGGGGYIGTPVATALLHQGFHVRNLDLFVYKTQSSASGLLLHDGYEVVVGDLCDTHQIDNALQGITDVVLLGGLVGDPITKAYPEESHAINAVGLQKCLDALNGRNLNKVIFVSTCSNYGLMENNELATEESELRPLSLYAEAKVRAEKHILAMKSNADFAATILRFATAFGVAPRMRFDLTVNEFTRELFLGNELVVYDANTWRPYCHVRDFARLIVRVLNFPIDQIAFEVFNAGGDRNNSTKQGILEVISKHVVNPRITYRELGSDPRNYRVDFRKVRERLLFEPEMSVDNGVVELLEVLRKGFFADYAEHRNFYGNYQLNYATA